jgi:hypothetical protein
MISVWIYHQSEPLFICNKLVDKSFEALIMNICIICSVERIPEAQHFTVDQVADG